MNKELTQKLYDKYPVIFAEKDKSEKESCMIWGFDCGDGWYSLIDALCSSIQCHCDNNRYHHKLNWLGKKLIKRKMFRNSIKWTISEKEGRESLSNFFFYKRKVYGCSQVVAKQVKEKFGSLRFYYEGGDEFIGGAVSLAESLSELVCEKCGGVSEITNEQGKYSSVCEKCKKG